MSRWDTQIRRGLVELAVLASIAGRNVRLSHCGTASEAGGARADGEHRVPGLDATGSRRAAGDPERGIARRPPRRYYRITVEGQKHLRAMACSWTIVSKSISELIEGVADMTMTMVELSEPLQAMIDTRLDTIDRILFGRMPRADRIAIVREVESQIHELLQEQSQHEPDREDILAVLVRLDPPEAYLP